jgi:magnesium-transporting ATPase (P-type)
MNLLLVVLKRCTIARAPHLWLAITGIVIHVAISIFAPLFQPDRGIVKMMLSYCRVLVAVIYVTVDMSLLAKNLLKMRNVNYQLNHPPYVILHNSYMRRDAFRIGTFPYKTFIHIVVAFFLFAAEDNLFQGVIGTLQFYLPHLSATNWVGTAVGVFINMGIFFLTFVINLIAEYLAECSRNQRICTVKVLEKFLQEPCASLKEVTFEQLQVLDVVLIKKNDKTPMGSFALCGRGLVNMRLANGENKDKPLQPLLSAHEPELNSSLTAFCSKLLLGWALYVSQKNAAKLIINDIDSHVEVGEFRLQPRHFLPMGTICLQDTYVLAAPMWDQRSQVSHKVTMAERYSRTCMIFMIKLAAVCVAARTLLLHYTETQGASHPPLPLWAIIVSSVIAFNGFVPISIQATLKIMHQFKGMSGLITDVIVSDKTGTLTRDNIIIDSLVMPPCQHSLTPYTQNLSMLETLVMTLEIEQDSADGAIKCSSQEDSALLRYLQKSHDLKFSLLMSHLRVFTICLDGVTTTHRFAVLDLIPYVSERARVNFYVSRCDEDNHVIGQPLLCIKGSRSELTRLCGVEYVDSMPFIADMDRYASECKRILYFTRSVVNQSRLERARALFDDNQRVCELTKLEDEVKDSKEFLFACIGSQDMQDGVTETLVMCHQRNVVLGMCTGDDPRVARSIMFREMDKAGFAALTGSCRCVEGSELVALTSAEVFQFVTAAKACGFFCVSNAKPEHKRRVVQVCAQTFFLPRLIHV